MRSPLLPRYLAVCVLACAVCPATTLLIRAATPPLVVYTAEKDKGKVTLRAFAGGEEIPVDPQLATAKWRRFGLRGNSPNSPRLATSVSEIDGDLPRIQVRGHYKIIAYSNDGKQSEYGRREGLAVLGARGIHILLEADKKHFRPKKDGTFISPDGRSLAIMVEGSGQEELIVLGLEPEIPIVRGVDLPGGIGALEPRSLTVTDGAVFFVARAGKRRSVVCRAPVAGHATLRAEVVSDQFEMICSYMAYSPTAIAFVAGEDAPAGNEYTADVFVAQTTGPPLNLTLSPGYYLANVPGGQRLSVSADGSAVAYSLVGYQRYSDVETFCHPVAVPGEGGRIHLTSDGYFAPYVEQDVFIFFRTLGGLYFTAGHSYRMDYYRFVLRLSTLVAGQSVNVTATAGEIINLTETAEPEFPYVLGTLTPLESVLTSSDVLLIAANGFFGEPGVVGISGESGATLFQELGLEGVEGFFDVGADTYFVAAADDRTKSRKGAAKGHALYRVRNGELAQLGVSSSGKGSSLLFQGPDRAFFYVDGTGLLELRPGEDSSLVVAGDLEPSVAVSPCGRSLVFSRDGDYFVVDLESGVETPLSGLPPDSGQVLAVGTAFVRGDVDRDDGVGIPDILLLIAHLLQGQSVECLDAADANDDGRVDTLDFSAILAHLFSGASLPPPFPEPGVDPTLAALSCCR